MLVSDLLRLLLAHVYWATAMVHALKRRCSLRQRALANRCNTGADGRCTAAAAAQSTAPDGTHG